MSYKQVVQKCIRPDDGVYLEDSLDNVGAELLARADGDRPSELVRGDGLVRQRIHPHGDLKVVEIVEEQAEVPELGKGDAGPVGLGLVTVRLLS